MVNALETDRIPSETPTVAAYEVPGAVPPCVSDGVHVIRPVAGSILAPAVAAAPVSVYDNVVFASGSTATTWMNCVELFSVKLMAWPRVGEEIVGASFTFVRLMTTEPLPTLPPLSVTWKVYVKLGVVSKFSSALLCTVIWPVEALIWNA